MTAPPATPPPLPKPLPALPPERVLRRLFLTLFLRGRSSRGLSKQGAPKSVGRKLAFTLVFYALMGMFALFFVHKPVFSLSIYLHGMTFVFLGMFVASSAGEVLFNKEESEILLHRPVTARALLWAKIGVLLQVSIWLAGALNLAGLVAGIWAQDGGWVYPIAHAISTILEALFCAGCVVVTYQLCLRWFGRERLESLMTTTQVLLAVVTVIGGQLVPQLIGRFGASFVLGAHSWWMVLLPPAWFAGFDDAIAGHPNSSSWTLAVLAPVMTGLVLWLAFGRLARDYEAGLQTLSEAAPARKPRPGRHRLADRVVRLPLIRWWLRNSVSRASFLLTIAYLTRDRDVKLRIYPGLAPMLVMPFIFLIQDRDHGGISSGGFGVAFTGCYLGLIPLLALNLLQYSQQWQAADLFRVAPIQGPSPLCEGARLAVFCFLTVPALVFFGGAAWLMRGGSSHLPLLLPGIIALPVYALIPSLGGRAVPLSLPTEEAKSAGRGLTMVGVMFVAMALAGLAAWAWSAGWFKWFLAGEGLIAGIMYAAFSISLKSARWPSME